ncbi:polysaccharide deacetylase family protein [Flavobacterium oreochromis]|uniref:polysaccharide deacetylase family protein n=1 Tax=Flavobacterium oreochromis TaxID=2906078 RepID=UPI001CE5BD94|nr:polysaccharide deacetylase family protein [Flavobacterium oreochromis]QYS86268.1 polysaccharide deacetylase family protein [Flavobacterium oreochromis]
MEKNKKNALVITFDDGYADNYLNALPLLEKYQIPATIFICSYNINSNEEFWWDRLANLYNQLPKKFINLKGKTVDKSQWSYKVLEKSVRDKNVFKIVENCKKIEELNNVNIELRESFRSLTTEELIELEKSSFIDIELHSHSHNHFSYLSFEEQKTDLIKNISELKKSLNNKKFKYFALPHGAYNSETLKVISEENLEGCLLANNYYSNYKNKFSKKINRILIPSITGHKLKKYLNKYIFDLF